MRVLIAGVGNVLRGDDGFGVAVARAMRARADGNEDLAIFEAGIAGIAFVQELMDGFDVLVIADALERGGEPGTVYLIEPERPDLDSIDKNKLHESLVDAHYADPSKVLILAQALNVLPPKVFLIGCQPQGFDELGAEMSAPVKAAVTLAVERIEALLASLSQNETA